MAIIDYNPAPTVKEFIKHHKPRQFFADWIIGPVGSGKTTGIFFKLVYLASKQIPSPVDGKRRVRAVVVRNTAPQLTDTTIVSWNIWFKNGEAGSWHATDKRFVLKFADVECEVLFRALDTPDDVARVLSLETTFAIIDEFVQIPKEIVDALAARCGRFPSQKDGGATNWGMWGSSNPGNEDDWWYEALQNAEQFSMAPLTPEQTLAAQVRDSEIRLATGAPPKATNWTYFQQPPGNGPDAENLNNLPGGPAYYTALAKDHGDAWVRQYIGVEWGYSISGTPVINTFNHDLHVAKKPLLYQSGLPLVAGYDPGMNCAMIFGQLDMHGRLLVLDELVKRDMGAQRFITTCVQPLMRIRFPQAQLTISPDPASTQRGQTNEQTVLQVVRKYYPVKIPDMNNRLPGRVDAIEQYTTRLTPMGPALLIDPRCKSLIRALRSGWRYGKSLKGDTAAEPLKNDYSHPGDAFGYLCKYFAKGLRGEMRRREIGTLPTFTNPYHMR
jgi:hypothetical protein